MANHVQGEPSDSARQELWVDGLEHRRHAAVEGVRKVEAEGPGEDHHEHALEGVGPADPHHAAAHT